MRRLTLIFSIILAIGVLSAGAQDPTATNYSPAQCVGSHRPYPAPTELTAYPDTLTPVFINHVGRHGARFPSSAQNTTLLIKALVTADSVGSITPLGRDLLKQARYISEYCRNRWGALDSLGMAEQRGIASRMFRTYPRLIDGGKVSALSSYSPRCIMSMYEFTHQLSRLNHNVEMTTSSGKQNSPLMRPFNVDTEYIDWRASNAWEEPYNMLYETTVPAAPARKIVGNMLTDSSLNRELSMTLYSFLASLPAMNIPADFDKYFTREELNACWAVDNLRLYLRYSASTLSTLPADIAGELLANLIATTDRAVSGQSPQTVMLRFGHAETLMPLLSLMRLRGCYYMTNYFDTTALHWRDFDIVPMGANLQMILFKSKKGNYYLRLDLNEKPIPLMPNSDTIYLPWDTARDYLNRCLPLHLQL